MRTNWFRKTAVALTIMILVGALAVSGRAMVMPPPEGGDPTHRIYVDNVRGSDDSAGDQGCPVATIDEAFMRMNASFAPMVHILVRDTGQPYVTSGINFKRNQVELRSYGGRALIEGETEGRTGLVSLGLDSVYSIYVANVDFLNVVFEGYATNDHFSSDITLYKLNFEIDAAHLLEGPVIDFHTSWGYPPHTYIISDVQIQDSTIMVRSDRTEPIGLHTAIHLNAVSNAQVYGNRLGGIVWNIGIHVDDSRNIKMAENAFATVYAGHAKMSLYKFDDAQNSIVYNER